VTPPALVLASTSVYRRQLLDRLGLPYGVEAPGVDETRRDGEWPAGRSERLAGEQAREVAQRHPLAWVIGSDQVAEREGLALGKPGDHERAVEQLRAASGKTVRFHTSLTLCQAASGTAFSHRDVTEVRFRALDETMIERYLRRERPYDCAGSFKSEGLGIVLFESIRSEDPTALIGLPMIALAKALRVAGFELP